MGYDASRSASFCPSLFPSVCAAHQRMNREGLRAKRAGRNSASCRREGPFGRGDQRRASLSSWPRRALIPPSSWLQSRYRDRALRAHKLLEHVPCSRRQPRGHPPAGGRTGPCGAFLPDPPSPHGNERLRRGSPVSSLLPRVPPDEHGRWTAFRRHRLARLRRFRSSAHSHRGLRRHAQRVTRLAQPCQGTPAGSAALRP
jgi:hypothetical protein